jgi:DNA polymerase-1
MSSLANVQLHLVDDLATANEMMRWLGERRDGGIAVDTETEGLRIEHDKVRLVQIGDEVHGWAIPWQRWGGVFLEAMDRYEGRLIFHNLKFDVGMIRATCDYQMPQDRCDDTMLMAHAIEPNMSGGLKQLAGRYVDPMALALQDQWKSSTGWTWATVPVDYEPYWTYAAMDTVLTTRLAAVLAPKVREMGAQRAYELELAATWVVEKMERNGIMVDRPFASEALVSFRSYAKSVSDWCAEHYGVRPSQNASVAQRLIADGIPLDKTTGTGAVQLDKFVLGPIAHLHPLANAVLEHRRYSKLASTYLRHFVEETSDEDPRLHPSIKSCGAVTTRMTMSAPNLQNLPRSSEDNPAAITVRKALIASPDHTLLMVDYDQVELRFLAHVSQDPGLIAAFTDPDVDVFTAIMRELWAEPTLQRKDERRQHTKNAMYAIGYGAGAAKFAKTAGLPLEYGQTMYAMIADRYPMMKGLNREIETRAMQRKSAEGIAYARSPLTGQIHPMDHDRVYTLVNKLVQGAAAELLKMKLVELDHAGFGPYLVLPVHDEIIFDMPTDQLPELTHTACDIMADDRLINVPITVAPSIGQSWGSKEDYVP